ncbi:MAG: Rrf2 family transcriptional regulator [Gammaproteobacteria bacterium]|nr:Rrf2 family transcriptional regulator [Gammaproteobacteria bacterium]
MQLTQFTDYSLRALIYIAAKKEMCTVSDIAKAYDISQHHLTKIIHNLSQLGMIKTTRGKNGGVILAKNAFQLNLKKIVLQLESDFDLVPCFNAKKNCCIAPACRLKGILADAQKAFLAVLEQFTLENILENEQEIQYLLKLHSKINIRVID